MYTFYIYTVAIIVSNISVNNIGTILEDHSDYSARKILGILKRFRIKEPGC